MRKTLQTLFTAFLLTAAPLAARAQAQDFPNHPIVLINPYAVGGPADDVARTVAHELSDVLGQPVVVQSKPGAGGSIGASYVAKAPADGYTLLLATSATQVIAPALVKPAPYDGVRDFAFVGMVGSFPNFLVVHPSVPAKSLQEFIALAKSKPGVLNYGATIGGSSNIGMEMLKQRAGIQVTHVPYKGAAPAITDLVGGVVQAGVYNASGVQAFVKSGRMRALAYGANARSPGLPGVPTFSEAGMPGFVTGTWYSVAVAAGTPKPIHDKLVAAFDKVLQRPAFKQRMADTGAEVTPMSPQELARFVRDEADAVTTLIKAGRVKMD